MTDESRRQLALGLPYSELNISAKIELAVVFADLTPNGFVASQPRFLADWLVLAAVIGLWNAVA